MPAASPVVRRLNDVDDDDDDGALRREARQRGVCCRCFCFGVERGNRERER